MQILLSIGSLPNCLLVVDENPEIGFHYAILCFGIPVVMRVEKSRKLLLNIKKVIK